jgi:Pentapeptide repeats (8 copies)
VAESPQRQQDLRQWRDQLLWRLLPMVVLATLAVLAGIAWLRWELAGLAITITIALVGWLIVWVVMMPGRLAPPVPTETLNEITDPKVRLEVTDARTRLRHDLRNGALQLLTVLAVLVGAGLGFQQLAEDRDQASQDRDQAIQDRQLTRQGQASERFTRAIDQLSSSRMETRIGGIYALDQIAEQSPEANTVPVGEVLLAWLNGRPRPNPPPDTAVREHAPDIQAALSVLTERRYVSIVANRLNLRGLGLGGADLFGAHLAGANLFGAHLFGAHLFGAHLFGANLRDADLGDANLRGGPGRREPARRGLGRRGPAPRGLERRGPVRRGLGRRGPARRGPGRRGPDRRDVG